MRNHGGEVIREHTCVADFDSSVVSKSTITLLPTKVDTRQVKSLHQIESKIRVAFRIWTLISVLFGTTSYFYFKIDFIFVSIFLTIWLCSIILMLFYISIVKNKLRILTENQSFYASSLREYKVSRVGCIYCSSVIRISNLNKHRKSIKCQKAQKEFHLTPEQKIEEWNNKMAEQRRLKKAQNRKKILIEEKKLAEENKQKERKKKAFTRRNFQPGHSSISMKKKEQIWKSGRSHGSCQNCNFKRKSVSFWWVIHPELKIKLLCDLCAKSMDLYVAINDEGKKSRNITRKVRDSVWKRDGGRCVECGSNENLEYDHIIPFSKGGSNTERNIQLLCEICNRSKSNRIGF